MRKAATKRALGRDSPAPCAPDVRLVEPLSGSLRYAPLRWSVRCTTNAAQAGNTCQVTTVANQAVPRSSLVAFPILARGLSSEVGIHERRNVTERVELVVGEQIDEAVPHCVEM